MKIVIDIDKRIYEHAKLREIEGNGSVYSQIIANGTPLPKGHGDLIDRDEVKEKIVSVTGSSYTSWVDFYVSTIIPAESEED